MYMRMRSLDTARVGIVVSSSWAQVFYVSRSVGVRRRHSADGVGERRPRGPDSLCDTFCVPSITALEHVLEPNSKAQIGLADRRETVCDNRYIASMRVLRVHKRRFRIRAAIHTLAVAHRLALEYHTLPLSAARACECCACAHALKKPTLGYRPRVVDTSYSSHILYLYLMPYPPAPPHLPTTPLLRCACMRDAIALPRLSGRTSARPCVRR